MQISKKLSENLSKQVKAEFESAYVYLSMANYLQLQSWPGMAHWFRMQAIEEERHAMKINDFLVAINQAPELLEIEKPKSRWNGPTEVFQEAYDHECQVSQMIEDLAGQALAEKNYTVFAFLQWFINEQVEEEAQSLELLERARIISDVAAGLIELDEQMAERPEVEINPVITE